jgi:hypothetical protein
MNNMKPNETGKIYQISAICVHTKETIHLRLEFDASVHYCV